MSFFLNEMTASDAGPDIIRSHLFDLGPGIDPRDGIYRLWLGPLERQFQVRDQK